MSKLNSCDERFRNLRDIYELELIADEATERYLAISRNQAADAHCRQLRARYEAIRARRQKEDRGEQTV